jgi:hypothetical protein
MLEAARGKPRALVEEQRRHQRVKVNLLGRFMGASSRQEYPCQIINMSPGGAAMISSVAPIVGERVIAYIDHIGRVEGTVARHFLGGFAIEIQATARKRDKLATQLTWLANRHALNLAEDRRYERMIPKNPNAQLTLSDGSTHHCRVVDMSLSGAAVTAEVRPALGESVMLGRVRARVIRQFETGIALEFASLQTEDSLRLGMAEPGER